MKLRAGTGACPYIVAVNDRIGVDSHLKLGQAQGPAPTLSLSDVVHRFKSMTTKRYTDGVKEYGWVPFQGRLWQRNYYEHIAREGEDLNRIRQYILNNPAQWAFDQENPDRFLAD